MSAPDEPQDAEPAVPEPATPNPRRTADVFVGRDGLRSGWSLLLYLALLVPLYYVVEAIAELFYSPARIMANPIQSGPRLLSESVAFLAVMLASWIMSKFESRSLAMYGIGRRRALPDFFAGLGWGLALLSLLVFILHSTGLLVFDGRTLFGASILPQALLWLAVFLSVSLLEEYFSRGYLQFTLARALTGLYTWLFRSRRADAYGFWTAAVLLSYMFDLGHSRNPGESPLGTTSAGLIGLVFCLSVWRTGSLWWAIGMHTAWDWAQSFLYGVADSGAMVETHLLGSHPVGAALLSGGQTGPEGSLYVLPVIAITALVILLTLRQRPNRSNLTPGPSHFQPVVPHVHLDLP